MEYNFNSRPTGKSASMMIQLKANIEKGLGCAVATHNPEKTKRDFEDMTGSKLKLENIEGTVNTYMASFT